MDCLPLLIIGAPGWLEILIIILIILLLFGAKRLPEVMGSLGKGVKEFKKGAKEVGRAFEEDEDDDGTGSAEPSAGGEKKKPEAGE